MIALCPHQTVNGVNIALIFDLLAFPNLQQRLNNPHRVFPEVHPLYIAFICLDFDPAKTFQLPQHTVCFLSAFRSRELIILIIGRGLLLKIILQFIG